MAKWFRRDNTEGFDENTLKVMNEEMKKQYDSLSDEERGNETYIDHLMGKILSQH